MRNITTISAGVLSLVVMLFSTFIFPLGLPNICRFLPYSLKNVATSQGTIGRSWFGEVIREVLLGVITNCATQDPPGTGVPVQQSGQPPQSDGATEVPPKAEPASGIMQGDIKCTIKDKISLCNYARTNIMPEQFVFLLINEGHEVVGGQIVISMVDIKSGFVLCSNWTDPFQIYSKGKYSQKLDCPNGDHRSRDWTIRFDTHPPPSLWELKPVEGQLTLNE